MEPSKKDIRFRQRFSNYEKACSRLKDALERDTKNDELIRSGLIQTFEFTFELAWKTMKDKLEAGGLIVTLPRDVIKAAYQAGYISDANIWIESLDSRNEMSHTYEEELSKKAADKIRNSFAPILFSLYEYFKKTI